MLKIDGRKLSHKTLEELRIRTVAQVEAGCYPDELARSLGFNRSTIYKWLQLKVNGGDQALYAKPIPGRPGTLNAIHLKWLCNTTYQSSGRQNWVASSPSAPRNDANLRHCERSEAIQNIHLLNAKWYKTLTDKTPQQLKLPFALWTRDQIIEVVKRKFGIKLSKSGLSRVLNKLGFTFQKPTVRYKQQDPVIVNKGLTTDYPAIQEEAKKRGADIYFGDEASVASIYALGKTIGKKGVTPIVHRTTKRFRVNMLSAVSAKGHCRFMVTKKSGTASVFITFLKRLLVGADKPIFLILANHPMHKSKLVQEFVEKHKDKLKLFFLPPYSPELNPDELVWNDVKNHGLSRHLVDNLETLKKLVYSRLFELQKKMSKIASFFETPTTSYARL